MKEIDLNEQKRILLDMLKYIDTVARKNNIKYTLVGGSLIGAVRNNGIIPWDDDVDIGLLENEYEKLVKCLKEEKNSRYKLLDVSIEPTYYYPFAKLIDTRTIGYEIGCKKINNYGVYIDIFKYNYIPDEEVDIKIYYDNCTKIKKILFRTFVNDSDAFLKKIYHKIMSRFNSSRYTKKLIKYSEIYNGLYDKNVMINWTPYGAKKETHLARYFNDFIDVNFDGVTAMIVRDYDKVLSNTFGDYMTPPPIEKQVSNHSMKMFWRDDKNEK